jgi:hypothetical protein
MEDAKDEKPSTISEAGFVVPIIQDIHQRVLEAIENKPEAFDMGGWHNTEASCGTTHCRAGWVVHLAGEAGYKLEAKTNTAFAAMQIYHASNPAIPVSPVRFYEDNKIALADIKRCAEAEKSLIA